MNALTELLNRKRERLLSVFFTAGYPEADSTAEILRSLQENQVDFVEVGMPYSDPLADGPVIQQTNTRAIANGTNIGRTLSQLKAIKGSLHMPVILMGYLNPVLQYGFESFCRDAREAGVSGLILPDLPMTEYEEHYKKVVLANDMHFIFLVTPTTRQDRIRQIDAASTAFIYAVSTSSTTGAKTRDEEDAIREQKISYLKSIKEMQLASPVIAGFGIHNKETLTDAWQWTSGAIIGTAYLQLLDKASREAEAITLLKNTLGLSPQ